jgi:hypothetical protein
MHPYYNYASVIFHGNFIVLSRDGTPLIVLPDKESAGKSGLSSETGGSATNTQTSSHLGGEITSRGGPPASSDGNSKSDSNPQGGTKGSTSDPATASSGTPDSSSAVGGSQNLSLENHIASFAGSARGARDTRRNTNVVLRHQLFAFVLNEDPCLLLPITVPR